MRQAHNAVHIHQSEIAAGLNKEPPANRRAKQKHALQFKRCGACRVSAAIQSQFAARRNEAYVILKAYGGTVKRGRNDASDRPAVAPHAAQVNRIGRTRNGVSRQIPSLRCALLAKPNPALPCGDAKQIGRCDARDCLHRPCGAVPCADAIGAIDRNQETCRRIGEIDELEPVIAEPRYQRRPHRARAGCVKDAAIRHRK